jgi:hypothetical protein
MGLVLIPSISMAQEPNDGNARERAVAEGPAAMDRLKDVMARRQAPLHETPAPSLPGLTDQQRKRAFEGLGNRLQSRAMELRAETAIAKGKQAFSEEREAMARH